MSGESSITDEDNRSSNDEDLADDCCIHHLREYDRLEFTGGRPTSGFPGETRV